MPNLTVTLEDILDPYVPVEELPMVTNLIKASISHSLPKPVDISSKYETTEEDGLDMVFTGKIERDASQLDVALNFAEDCGYNSYRKEVCKLLKIKKKMVK